MIIAAEFPFTGLGLRVHVRCGAGFLVAGDASSTRSSPRNAEMHSKWEHIKQFKILLLKKGGTLARGKQQEAGQSSATALRHAKREEEVEHTKDVSRIAQWPRQAFKRKDAAELLSLFAITQKKRRPLRQCRQWQRRLSLRRHRDVVGAGAPCDAGNSCASAEEEKSVR